MIESWATEQARKVIERIERLGKTVATFECGFGPSGLPHIGTVAEMLRTRMVIRAFEHLTRNADNSPGSKYKVQWILFADDLDALRKVPETIPEDKVLLMDSYMGTSVCKIPDPWGTEDSYASHNIAELVRMLARCEVMPSEYTLLRSSRVYGEGKFNDVLDTLVDRAQEIKDIITHDYSAERVATYFPFLPIIHGKVHQNVLNWHVYKSHFEHRACFSWQKEEDQTTYLTQLANGSVKCQWKLDWPMRWMAFDVDFEMHGKDLIGSASVGRRICKLFEHEEPVIFMYELFLDEEKQKISKSKGNGLEADEWLTYGSVESLQYYLFQNPVKGRILHWSCIPQYEDMYAKELANSGQTVSAIGNNDETGSAIWFVHGDDLPYAPPVTYNLLLNLVGIADTEDTSVLWDYLNAYKPGLTPQSHPSLNYMMEGAIRYYQKFVLPKKVRREPTHEEQKVLLSVRDSLTYFIDNGPDFTMPVTGNDLRTELYDIGKYHYTAGGLRDYFQMLYQVLLGQDSGPQFDQFVRIASPAKVVEAINAVLE